MTGARIDDPDVGDAVQHLEQAAHRQDAADVYKGYLERRVAPQRRRGADLRLRDRAGDRRARLRGEDGPDRVPPAEHHRRPVAGGARTRPRRRANWQPRVAGSNLVERQRRDGPRRRLRHATAPPLRSAAVVEIEVNKKTGKITVTHIYNAIDAGLVVNPERRREPDGRAARSSGVSRALLETFDVQQDAGHEPRLGHVPDPALQGRAEGDERRRPAAGQAAARRGRAAVLPDPGGGRERVLRRDGRAHPPGADDAGPRPRRR